MAVSERWGEGNYRVKLRSQPKNIPVTGIEILVTEIFFFSHSLDYFHEIDETGICFGVLVFKQLSEYSACSEL